MAKVIQDRIDSDNSGSIDFKEFKVISQYVGMVNIGIIKESFKNLTNNNSQY